MIIIMIVIIICITYIACLFGNKTCAWKRGYDRHWNHLKVTWNLQLEYLICKSIVSRINIFDFLLTFLTMLLSSGQLNSIREHNFLSLGSTSLSQAYYVVHWWRFWLIHSINTHAIVLRIHIQVKWKVLHIYLIKFSMLHIYIYAFLPLCRVWGEESILTTYECNC